MTLLSEILTDYLEFIIPLLFLCLFVVGIGLSGMLNNQADVITRFVFLLITLSGLSPALILLL